MEGKHGTSVTVWMIVQPTLTSLPLPCGWYALSCPIDVELGHVTALARCDMSRGLVWLGLPCPGGPP